MNNGHKFEIYEKSPKKCVDKGLINYVLQSKECTIAL
jgi:hypothetical protein